MNALEGWGVTFDPMLPWLVLGPLFTLAAVLVLFALFRGVRAATLRGLAALVLGLLLLNPSLIQEDRTPLTDVAVILVDDSPSQRMGDRRAQTEATRIAIEARLNAEPNLEVRTVAVGAEDGALAQQTRLFSALDAALEDVPRGRRAGVIAITDGQIHDTPAVIHAGRYGPFHALITGDPETPDRRLTIVETPSYAVVDEPASVVVRIDDSPGPQTGSARLTLRMDGRPLAPRSAVIGEPIEIPIPIAHAGETVLEIEVEAMEGGELTLANNRAAVAVNGVRDRLRVLLVSGRPHMGERGWRNILKSDPSVDLVHFTILRPPERQDGTPLAELSLIAFPIAELFEERLWEFDLIIFDQYERSGVLPAVYLANIASYVRRGGALLDASGAPFAGNLSLYQSPLGEIYPGAPTGEVLEAFYRPEVTEIGRRHPVTAALEGAGVDDRPSRWGRWLSQVDVQALSGEVVMEGLEGRPLLILDRVGEGRVAQIASDHLWLWSRGFEGGGPQAELVRRLAHWLMGEPSLEEEVLEASAEGDRVTITRRSLGMAEGPVTVILPDGERMEIALEPVGDGQASGAVTLDRAGIVQVQDGARTALAIVGDPNAPEMLDLRPTDAILAGAAEASGGSVTMMWQDGRPVVHRVAAGSPMAGDGWIGIADTGAYTVTGVRQISLTPAWIALALLALALAAAWAREGR